MYSLSLIYLNLFSRGLATVVRPYWESVITELNELCDGFLQLELRMALLSIMQYVLASRYLQLFLFFALYYAHRELLLRWKQPTLPTLTSWVSAVNAVLPLYKLSYENRGCLKKYVKVWFT